METMLSASQEFYKACSYLNKYNLTDLWKVSSILSCIDNFDTSLNRDSVLFPLLNFVKINMFDKAILHSSARDYKKEVFDSKKLPEILNSLNNATNTDELDNQNKDPKIRILDFLSKIANSQFQFQKGDFGIRILRTYALYKYIPTTFEKRLKNKHKNNYVNIPKTFKDNFQISIKHYLILGLTLFAFYKFKSKEFLNPDKKIVEKINKQKSDDHQSVNYKSRLLYSLIDNHTRIRDEFCFDINDLLIKEQWSIGPREAQAFLNLLSKSSKELGLLQNDHLYNIGEIVYRLSPLERYPIIKLNGSKYIVPNIRYFLVSLTNILHFVLQKMYPENQFNETFGSVYELYIVEFLKDRLHNKILIPEIRYKKARNYVDGPDLTIIDKDNNSIILIEVKSKNLTLDSRLNPMSANLLEDIGRALDSLKKLQGKLDDLYYGYKEYAPWQNDINLINKKNVYFCVVIGRGIYLLPEVINFLRELESSHFLNHFDYKYAIMQSSTFEKGIELVYHNKTTLPNLIQTYWKSSITQSPKEYLAELLGGLKSDSDDIYLRKLCSKIFNEYGLSI